MKNFFTAYVIYYIEQIYKMSSYGFTEGGIGYIGSYPGGFVGKNKIYVWTWEQSVYERDVEKLNVYFPKQGESIVFGKCYSLDSEAK